MEALRENLKPRPSRTDLAVARSIRKDQGLRFSAHEDRTFEVNKLFLYSFFALALQARDLPVVITGELSPRISQSELALLIQVIV